MIASEAADEVSGLSAALHHMRCAFAKSAADRHNTNDTNSAARDILAIPVGAITAVIAKLSDITAEKESCRDNDDQFCRIPGFDNGAPDIRDEGYAPLARSWHP
jgi:hypothetical protein